MGDKFGSDRVTGYCLWSIGNHRQKTELQYVALVKTITNGTQTGVITH